MFAEIDKDELKRRIEDEHPEWRESKPMPLPIKDVLATMLRPEIEPIEHYGKDPWWIMRVVRGMYKTAEKTLMRAGFECYSPTYKVIGPMPLRLIPPKKRGNAGLYKREVRKRRYDGYLFIRRLFGHYDLNRLFDLDGCGSIITNASSTALVYDYEIEVMRLAEFDGTLDEVQVETYRGYKVSRLAKDGGGAWTGRSKIVGRLDDSSKTVLFVERMGRIARIISQADR